jgi:dephospho-CoA kinase
MLRIGLTGGIGSGKSTVAALLAGHGASVVDTDVIARELTLAGGAAIAPIRATFGDAYIDGTGALDRERMRSLAFSDPQAKGRLEAILHPLISAEATRQSDVLPAGIKVFDVPLLVESGRWQSRVNRVLVVDCSETTQLQRVLQRSGWLADTVRAVMAQQAPRALRLACADAVIYNDGLSLSQLSAEVDALWAFWCAGVPDGTL